MAILKLDKHNKDKEIEFELMFRKTKEIRNLLKRNERRKATEVIKRKPD
jgi:hypothetical protein